MRRLPGTGAIVGIQWRGNTKNWDAPCPIIPDLIISRTHWSRKFRNPRKASISPFGLYAILFIKQKRLDQFSNKFKCKSIQLQFFFFRNKKFYWFAGRDGGDWSIGTEWNRTAASINKQKVTKKIETFRLKCGCGWSNDDHGHDYQLKIQRQRRVPQ